MSRIEKKVHQELNIGAKDLEPKPRRTFHVGSIGAGITKFGNGLTKTVKNIDKGIDKAFAPSKRV